MDQPIKKAAMEQPINTTDMKNNTFFVRGVSARTERHCRLFVAGAMPNRIWRIRNLRRRLRIIRRRLRVLRRIRILRRARQARNDVWFNFSLANAMVGDFIVEKFAFGTLQRYLPQRNFDSL